jgi:hypothetical protein
MIHLPRHRAVAWGGAALLVCALTAACGTDRAAEAPTAPTAAPAPASTPAAAPLPTGPVTLSDWQLTLPTTGRKGGAATVDPATDAPPYLVTGPDGSLALWTPVGGTTTPNSPHTRTELDHHDVFAAGSARHVMSATLVVTQLPSEWPDVIVGQIHGSRAISSIPFVMLHYQQGQLDVVVKTSRAASGLTHVPLLDDVPLGTPFAYTIADNGDGTMTFSATSEGRTVSGNAPVPDAFRGAPVRFQAGDYQQADSVAGAAPDDGARVTFRALTVS